MDFTIKGLTIRAITPLIARMTCAVQPEEMEILSEFTIKESNDWMPQSES